jgi:hypothetical protein
MISLLFFSFFLNTRSIASPCARAYVPGLKAGGLVERRLAASGVAVANPETKEERWKELVASASLEQETANFDLVDRDVFLRRLEALPLPELARLYPGIQELKLKTAKERVNPCAH